MQSIRVNTLERERERERERGGELHTDTRRRKTEGRYIYSCISDVSV